MRIALRHLVDRRVARTFLGHDIGGKQRIEVIESDAERTVLVGEAIEVFLEIEDRQFGETVLQDEVGQRGLDAKAATRKQTFLDELLGRAEHLMEQGMKSKVLRKADPSLYAAILVGMMRGVALSSLSARTPLTGKGADIVNLFMRGAAR